MSRGKSGGSLGIYLRGVIPQEEPVGRTLWIMRIFRGTQRLGAVNKQTLQNPHECFE